jgi:hypothetical protein
MNFQGSHLAAVPPAIWLGAKSWALTCGASNFASRTNRSGGRRDSKTRPSHVSEFTVLLSQLAVTKLFHSVASPVVYGFSPAQPISIKSGIHRTSGGCA